MHSDILYLSSEQINNKLWTVTYMIEESIQFAQFNNGIKQVDTYRRCYIKMSFVKTNTFQ